MKKMIPSVLFLLVLITFSSQAQDQVRKLIRYDLFQNPLLQRDGSALTQLLVTGAVAGEITPYRMVSYSQIEPMELEILKGSIVNRHIPQYDPEDSYWRDSEPYYYGDIIYQDGILFEAIGNDFVDKSPDNTRYWRISDNSLVNPADLTQIVVDVTEGNGTTYNFVHFWYDDAWHGENYYLFSFKVDDCQSYLRSRKVPIYREADPNTGFVAGSVFIIDAFQRTNRQLAQQAMQLPSYSKVADPFDEQLSVNMETGAVFNTGDGIQLLGNFDAAELLGKLQNEFTFEGFYDMSQFVHFLSDGEEEEISKNGTFVNDNDQVIFGQATDSGMKDPFSAQSGLRSPESAQPLEGQFTLMEIMAVDLEYPDNPVLNGQGKEVSRLLINAVRANKIKTFYRDMFLTEKATKEGWLAELAVRDWEMEEEYRSLPYWDPNESYEARDKIIVSDTVYISEADFNRGNDPENFQGGFWKIDKILSNTEMYKFEEFNLLYLAYEKTFDQQGQVESRILKAIQPVVGLRYSVEDHPITPGFIPIEACAPILSAQSTSVDGARQSYQEVMTSEVLTGIPIRSGNIRKSSN